MRRRLLGAVVPLAVATTLVGSLASAKEGVVARVLTPIEREAPAGTRVTVVWTLSFVENGTRRPFEAGGIFVRLFGPGDARSPRAFAESLRPGRYRAIARVPRGGVRRVVVGLMGERCSATCRPAPMAFRIAGDPLR